MIKGQKQKKNHYYKKVYTISFKRNANDNPKLPFLVSIRTNMEKQKENFICAQKNK